MKNVSTIVSSLVALFVGLSLSTTSCRREPSHGFNGDFCRYVDTLNMALDEMDTVKARKVMSKAFALASTPEMKSDMACYKVILSKRGSDFNSLMERLDSSFSGLGYDCRAQVRFEECRALMLLDEGRTVEALSKADLAAALAYRHGDGDSYVRLRIMRLRRMEERGEFAAAIDGYLQALEYARRDGLHRAQSALLLRLVSTFISMGDLRMAQTYLDKMSTVLDSSCVSRCSYYFAIARMCSSTADTVTMKRTLALAEAAMGNDSLATVRYGSTLLAFKTSHFLASGLLDSAANCVNQLEREWHEGVGQPPKEYVSLLKARVLLSQSKMYAAREILNNIDAASLRTTDVDLYEYYADVVTRYYTMAGDDHLAYLFLRQKSSLLDSLRQLTEFRNVAYRNMELRRDTTIASQGLVIDQMEGEMRRLDIVKTLWSFVGIFLVLAALATYVVISVRRMRERRRKLAELSEVLADEVRLKRDQLNEQREQLNEQNKQMMDELVFANHIQSNILPPEDLLDAAGIADHFIIFSPCNMVSGDFYWIFDSGDKLFVCVADATGHGVPGAFISMVASTLLSDIVFTPARRDPASMVESLSRELAGVLRTNCGTNEDSVDLSLMCLDRSLGRVTLCLARHTAYVIRANGQSFPVTGVKRSVGEGEDLGGGRHPFVSACLDVSEGDCLYMTTDGFVSQFGGQHNQKFKRRRFEQLLKNCHTQRMNIQREAIVQCFDDWRGDNDQTDDVLVIGLRFADLKNPVFSRFNSFPYISERYAIEGLRGADSAQPAQMSLRMVSVLKSVIMAVGTPGLGTRILDILPLFDDCFIEWVGGVVRVTPSLCPEPQFAMAELVTGGVFSCFGECVRSVVLTLPFGYDADAGDFVSETVSVSRDVCEGLVRLTISNC